MKKLVSFLFIMLLLLPSSYAQTSPSPETLINNALQSTMINIKNFSAAGNARRIAGVVTLPVGSHTLTAPTAIFTVADVGKVAIVTGAGPASAALVTTITGYTSPTVVTLSAAGVSLPPTVSVAGNYTFVWGVDDSAAIQAAVSAVNAKMSAGQNVCLYAPGGNYLVSSPPGIFTQGLPGCVIGDGPSHTSFWLTPGFSGDMFAWSEAWIPNTSGPLARDFRIDGWLGAPAQQNGLMFYDRNDNVAIYNVDEFNIPGQAFRSGIAKNTAYGFMRESVIDKLRVQGSGLSGVPAVEFNNLTGGGDATNEIAIGTLNIYGSNGPSFVVRNSGTTTAGGITIDYLRVEGTEYGTTAADLVTIGDPVLTGQVASVTIRNAILLDPYTGYAALRLTAPSLAAAPYYVRVDSGSIGGGLPNGKGLEIDAGHDNRFRFSSIATVGTNVTVGTAALVGSGNYIDGDGHELTWTYNIGSGAWLSSPIWRQSNSTAYPSLVMTQHDGSPSGGATGLGTGSVDLQVTRFANTQIASGANSGILSGGNNTAGGQFAVISGGNANTNTGFVGTVAGGNNNLISAGNFGTVSGGQYNKTAGTGSTIPGGQYATDRARTNWFGWASGQFITQGDAQTGAQLLRGTTTSASTLQLTADMAAAGASNIINIPLSTNYHLRTSVTCRDNTVPGWATWYTLEGNLDRSAATNAAYAGGYISATAPSRSGGPLTTMTLTLAADVVNQGLTVTVTPPSGNTDTIHCVARVDTLEEVQ